MSTKSYLTLTKKYKAALLSTHSIYRLFNSTFDSKYLLLRLCKLLSQIMDSNYCLIVLLDNSKKFSNAKAMFKSGKTQLMQKKNKIVNFSEKKVIRTGQAVCKRFSLCVPLISEDIIGLIVVKRTDKVHSYDSFDKEILMTLSEQIVMCIKNFRLYEEQQKTILGAIKAITILLNTKVPHFYLRSRYFTRILLEVGKRLRLNGKELRSLEYAALLHDAGKIDLPANILYKSTRLTGEEFKIMQRHPVKAVQILKPLQILRPAIPIVLHHHEKYDGTGYPSGLKKGKIPLGSRIMAVVDAFDAMVLGRPYKERISFARAVKEIKSKSGTQFDPEVVEVFLEVIRKFKKTLKLE